MVRLMLHVALIHHQRLSNILLYLISSVGSDINIWVPEFASYVFSSLK